MRWYGVLVMFLVCCLAMSCQENLRETQDDRNLDAELVNALNNLGVENAIVAQHTLYPYHFVSDAEELNELGRRDLLVLAGHFRRHEGILNVRRGETPPELYEARLTHTIDELRKAGVDTDRMGIADGMPGGAGMPSTRVINIMERSFEPGSSTPGTSYTGTITR